MKNIRTFESYTVEEIPDNSPIKPYGVPYSLTNLNVGDKVTYLGTQCEVKSVDEYLLTLTTLETKKEIRCNQAMFNKNGFIGR
jgi:hypothetical protein